MAANLKKTGKGKPCVYLCARSGLSPLLMHVVRMLSRYVTIRSGIDDPESAYLAIHECDVFIFLLDTETCRQLFAIYELGVAVVFQTPIIMIREMKLTAFSQLRVPPHFYKTEILMRPSGRSTGRRAVHSRSLGELLVYGFKKSVIFSPESLSKSEDELLGRIISFGRFRRRDMMLRDLGSFCTTKARKKSLVKISRTGVRNSQQKLLLEAKKPVDCSSQTPSFDGLIPEVSLIPLCTQTNYVANFNADENEESARSILVKFPRKLNELMPRRKHSDEETEQTYDFIELDVKAPISPNLNTTPLPSPIPPHDSYYPTALPVNPMDISFPPFQVEDLDFNKCALAIAKSDRLPSIIRRRIMRKGL